MASSLDDDCFFSGVAIIASRSDVTWKSKQSIWVIRAMFDVGYFPPNTPHTKVQWHGTKGQWRHARMCR
jgi:hypothetical protein